MRVMCRALFLPLLLSLALHFALFAEPLLRTMVFSLQASAAAVPMLQVSLASRDTPESPPPARRGEQSGDDLPADLPLADVPEAVAAESPASAVADPLAGSGIVSALVPEPAVNRDDQGRKSFEGKLPQQGELTYNLYWSKDRWLVGQAVHRWSVDGGGHYILSSESKTTGLFALIHPLTIADETHGFLTDQGMAPFHYVTRANDEPAATVHFDRQTSRVRFYLNNVARPAATVEGRVFDKLSFLYQLYLMRPQEKTFTIMITLGYRIESYVIEAAGEEEIETGLGSMNAVHLRRINLAPGDDHVEVWLAPAMDYLPVKLLFFNDRGQYYEQTIRNVKSAADARVERIQPPVE